MKKEILNDLIFEKSVKTNLYKSLQLIQNLLNIWENLGFDKLTSSSQLYDLLNEPSLLYAEAIEEMTKTPPGLPEKEASEWLNNQDIPDAKSLINATKACNNDPFTQRKLSLFYLKNGSVQLKNTDPLVKKKSVYAENQKQLDFFERLQNLIAELNNLNTQTGYQLVTGRELSQVFATPLRGETGTVNIDPEGLRKILENFK